MEERLLGNSDSGERCLLNIHLPQVQEKASESELWITCDILSMGTCPEILTVPFIEGLVFSIEDYLVTLAMG